MRCRARTPSPTRCPDAERCPRGGDRVRIVVCAAPISGADRVAAEVRPGGQLRGRARRIARRAVAAAEDVARQTALAAGELRRSVRAEQGVAESARGERRLDALVDAQRQILAARARERDAGAVILDRDGIRDDAVARRNFKPPFYSPLVTPNMSTCPGSGRGPSRTGRTGAISSFPVCLNPSTAPRPAGPPVRGRDCALSIAGGDRRIHSSSDQGFSTGGPSALLV